MAREPEERSDVGGTDAHLDEVGVAVGPDRDALGLFDVPTTGTATSEHTEGPPAGPDRGEARRTAVLAWIAAQPPLMSPPVGDGVPCAPLKRLIADEPLDPLPALDGVPFRGREPARRPAVREPVELSPEREDTATQIEGFEAMLERRGDGDTSEEAARPRPAGSADVEGPADTPAPEATPPTPAPGAPAVPVAPPARWLAPRVLLLVAFAAVIVAWVLQAVRGG